MERLQKLIAASGLCSRRQAEALIVEGKVAVNGKTVRELGSQAGPQDVVTLNGRPLPRPETVTYLLNKPKGYVCSLQGQGKQRLVTELVPAYPRVYPVGRLDKDSQGLLVLTNDGALSAQLTHPKFGHAKSYAVYVKWQGEAFQTPEWIAKQLIKGTKLGDGIAKADTARVRALPDGRLRLSVTVHEGRHHLVRRMCATLGLDVTSLERTGFATLSLGKLKPGDWRLLKPAELQQLSAAKISHP